MKALEIHDLKKTYPNGLEALKGISLSVEEGEFVALLGPNGAGKSTTISILCSLVQKTAGKVSVCGYDIDTDFPLAKQQLGIVPQEFNFNSFEKVEDILVTQAGYYGVPARIARKRAEQYMSQLGLLDKRHTVARMLSGGMKRRLMIARALVHEPRILVLDEPTAGVDIELRRSMWQFLKDRNAEGTTIILTTHYLEEAEALCKRVAIIDKGNLVADMNTRDLLKRLQIETFVLDLLQPVPEHFALLGYEAKVIDPLTLEVTLDKQKQQTANELFVALSSQGLVVQSLRNKANRLEELFVRILEGKEESTL